VIVVVLAIVVLGASVVYRSLARYGVLPPMSEPVATVVLLTMDGVRLQELLSGSSTALSNQPPVPVLPNLMKKLAPQGVFLGDASQGSRVRIGNPMGISMSGYQTLFAGRFKLCVRNECSAVAEDTLLTGIAEAFGPSILFLSAYRELCAGVTAAPSSAVAVCGLDALRDYASESGVEAADSVDDNVINLGLQALRQNPPRLVYLGLDESDSVGHSGDYPAYLDVLARYDVFLAALWAEVEKLNAQGHPTSLIVTTDHGRGHDRNWTQHRWNIRGSNAIWIFGGGHGIQPKGVVSNSKTRALYDIRPTIEHLLGTTPKPRFWGEAITEFFE